MNDTRIKQYVDSIFKDVRMTATAMDQKEELIVNITERVRDYMRDGLSFETAFETAKNNLGDTDELIASFEKITGGAYDRQRQNAPEAEVDDAAPTHADARRDTHTKFKLEGWSLAAISPFIYILLGFAFDWWAWAWVVIPVFSIIGTPMPRWTKIVSLSPFAYVMLGFLFGWWAWAWVIIPVSAILSQAVRRHV